MLPCGAPSSSHRSNGVLQYAAGALRRAGEVLQRAAGVLRWANEAPIPALEAPISLEAGRSPAGPSKKEMKPMKKPFLFLLALLALISSAQLMAQTPTVAVPPAPDVTQFLATLSDGPAQAPSDLVPAPSLMTGCTPQCPTGQLCCNVCGNPPDDGGSCMACVTPVRGRCPLVV